MSSGLVTDSEDQSASNEVLTSSGDLYSTCSLLPTGQKGHLASVDTDPEEYQLHPRLDPQHLPKVCLKCHTVKLTIQPKKKYEISRRAGAPLV